jgi:tetratricopeptide (TPR) repeat protein
LRLAVPAALALFWAANTSARASDDRVAFATLENGLSVGFALVRTAEPEAGGALREAALARSNSVSRVLFDRESGAFFGYRLTADRAGAGRVKLAFQPLANGIESEVIDRLSCPACPAPARIPSPRFPAPQELKEGETVSLELLAKPATGERILDVIAVSPRPLSPEAMRAAAARTLEVWQIGQKAATMVARGNYEEATIEYRKVLALTPNDAVVHNKLGIAYQTLGRYGPARREYDQALALRPGYPEAWNNVGTLEQARGRFKQAIAAYRKAVEIKPALATPWKNMGSAFLALGRVQEGLSAYRRAYGLDPGVLESRTGAVASGLDPGTESYYLAKMFAGSGQAEVALQFLLKAEAAGFHDWDKVRSDPDFKFLGDDPRFQQLLGRGASR